jgi:hypothetical protein
MTLHDVLHEVLRHLELRPLTDVTIERGDDTTKPDGRSEIRQLRFGLDETVLTYEYRWWMGEQWARWLTAGGISFELRDVLATDWRILPP